MIENKRLRFKRSEILIPEGLPEAVEESAPGRVLRWYVAQAGADEVVVEATIDSEPLERFDDSVLGEHYPGKTVAVSIIPTGVGCSVGGFAGDAAPATRLLSAATDYLITNPNAVNASDFIRLDANVLYAEGYCIDLFSRGLVNLYLPYANRVGVIIERSSEAKLDLAFNVINAVRAVHGVDIEHCVITDGPIGSRSCRNESGAFVGTLDHPEVLADACQSLLRKGVDAIAVASNVQDLSPAEYALHFAGQIPNPVGGVEAIISHSIVNRFRVPAAHAPLQNVRDLDLESAVVDARAAGEMASPSGLACVLLGLARAPQIVPRPGRRSRDIVNLNNLLAVVAPATCLGGIPALFAQRAGIPVIAVASNESLLEITAEQMRLEGVVQVASYAEAAGVLLALRHGLALQSLVRPLATLRHAAAQRSLSAPRRSGSAVAALSER
ncbi:MAG TPA: DUF3326 domain-containing protein [Thermoanaerobaculia bacterium]|nr:DUF3326 domain-containing protein [Thermoanaerobaculia bacterium]